MTAIDDDMVRSWAVVPGPSGMVYEQSDHGGFGRGLRRGWRYRVDEYRRASNGAIHRQLRHPEDATILLAARFSGLEATTS